MKLIRVTDERDGTLLNRGYAYHSQSVMLSDDRALAFVAHSDGPPRFFEVNIQSGDVQRLGALIADHPSSTGEGWYLNAVGDVYLTDGPQLLRVNPFNHDTSIAMATGDVGHRFWQAHSSDDGRAHSATLQRITSDGPYVNEGTFVLRGSESLYVPADGALDESHMSGDGRNVIIEENDNNRIITLETGVTRRLSDNDGALSHIDCGPNYMVGEDNIRGACVLWNLETMERRDLFGTWNQGHVSVRAGRCVQSNDTNLNLVALDGSGVTLLGAHGMVGSGYDYQCMANLSPCGRVVAYVSNVAGRFDLYLLVL